MFYTSDPAGGTMVRTQSVTKGGTAVADPPTGNGSTPPKNSTTTRPPKKGKKVEVTRYKIFQIKSKDTDAGLEIELERRMNEWSDLNPDITDRETHVKSTSSPSNGHMGTTWHFLTIVIAYKTKIVKS